MKYRALTLLFAICFISNLALSEDGTDAPLMPNDGITPVAQTVNCENQRGHVSKKKTSAAVEAGKTGAFNSAGASQQQSASQTSVPAHTAPASGGN